MKKIISVLLIIALLPAIASFGAVEYHPTDHYTVSIDTPTCEEAIEACGGDLENGVQYVYFQLPAVDPEAEETAWTNRYNSTDLGLAYCQVCVYWWSGTGSVWPDGSGIQWVGYKTALVDPDNRIYRAAVPNDGNTLNIVWNNGVNGGTDPAAEIFGYTRQLKDANVEGAIPGDYDTLPEGSPDPNSMNGCILVYEREQYPSYSPTTGYLPFAYNWYVYYGGGCYGCYPTDSENYHGKKASCVNPEHFDANGEHIAAEAAAGDANGDGKVDISDATTVQRYDVKMITLTENALLQADVDRDQAVTILDATWIQRHLANMPTPYPIG